MRRGKLFKDVTKIKDVTQDIMSSYGENPKSQFLQTSSMNSIRHDNRNVNERLSYEGENINDLDQNVPARAEGTNYKENAPGNTKYIYGDVSQESVEASIMKVAKMEPVTRISGEEFAKGETDLVTQVSDYFEQLGNRVYNPQLGSVTLDRQGVRSDIGHGIGRKKLQHLLRCRMYLQGVTLLTIKKTGKVADTTRLLWPPPFRLVAKGS